MRIVRLIPSLILLCCCYGYAAEGTRCVEAVQSKQSTSQKASQSFVVKSGRKVLIMSADDASAPELFQEADKLVEEAYGEKYNFEGFSLAEANSTVSKSQTKRVLLLNEQGQVDGHIYMFERGPKPIQIESKFAMSEIVGSDTYIEMGRMASTGGMDKLNDLAEGIARYTSDSYGESGVVPSNLWFVGYTKSPLILRIDRSLGFEILHQTKNVHGTAVRMKARDFVVRHKPIAAATKSSRASDLIEIDAQEIKLLFGGIFDNVPQSLEIVL